MATDSDTYVHDKCDFTNIDNEITVLNANYCFGYLKFWEADG